MEPERDNRDEANRIVSRRTLLRRAGAATGGLVAGSALAGQVAAEEKDPGCLRTCWVDVKPSSCPNSVNPGSQGVVPVSAGWPNFEFGTVELIPVQCDYNPAFECCQDFERPVYRDTKEAREKLYELAQTSERSAEPVWSRVEDVDGDGDFDSKFKFHVSDLNLRSGDNFLVLRGESSTGDCTYYGIDSVRVVGGNQGGPGGPGEKKGSHGKGKGK